MSTLFTGLKSVCLKCVALKTSGLGGIPGLVVMGGDSWSKGHRFESQHHLLDGHFFTFVVVKIIKFVWKDENKRKRVRGWPIFLKKRRGPIYKRINAKQESWLVAIMSDLCNNRQWQKTTTGVVFPSKLFCAKIESSWIKRWVGGRSKKTLFDLPWIVRSGDKKLGLKI